MTIPEMIAVMQAFHDGKQIQWRPADAEHEPWRDATPVWDWKQNDYRVKPEPFECWVNVYPACYVTVYFNKGCAAAGLNEGGRTVHMREVED